MTSHDSNRWASHLIKCCDAPDSIKDKLQNKRRATTSAFIETPSRALELVDQSPQPGTTSSSGVNKWIDRVNASDSQKLDELFGKCFYYTGVPFRFADSPSLGTFIKT